ncbi:S8 family serine peptidase [Embleya hyalina]|uniref:Serine protease n=1 Tax=Embleya hyalina TaxID=516124 RepID=A0A401YQE5_9ACTN|nr:S8 family serine peptidase [Embleya hyalina]GCD96834.1 serine protease [Embleya hyalina]
MHRYGKRSGKTSASIGAAAIVLTATLVSGGGASAVGLSAPADRTPTGRPETGEAHDKVTLVTGDRVRVDRLSKGRVTAVSVEPGPGREGMVFTQWRSGASVSVVPADALGLLDQGVLDARLFDVTGLLRAGYDDRSRPTVPLIVQSDDPGVLRRGPGRELPSIGARALLEPKSTTGEFWQSVTTGSSQTRVAAPGITRIWLDGRVAADLDLSVPQIGAPSAWQAGYSGQGVRTAVLDTGIDPTHPDLVDAVTQSADFTDNVKGVRDGNGHGTHVASIVTGGSSTTSGSYKGVAPDSTLLVGKVLDDEGFGSESRIIAGMQWATDNGARVVNMSLGSGPGNGKDPMSLAVDRLTATTGALFVVAAGNDGPIGGKVSAPGAATAALTVGAIDRDGSVAPFSSTGPRLGDQALKPELTAPGVAIAAARAAGTHAGTPVGDSHTRLSGTSMATPHVAGAAALLAQQHPTWRADRLKAALIGTAEPTPDTDVFAQGAGRVEVTRAVTQNVFAEQSTLSLFSKWPHTSPVVHPLTYRNDGDTPESLDLRVEGTSAITLDSTHVTVPAHGTVDVTVTFTASGTGQAPLGAILLATGTNGRTVRVPISAHAESEMYDVTLDVRDRNGGLPQTSAVRLVDLRSGESFRPTRAGDSLVVRVPKGRYGVDAMIRTPAGTDAASWTVAGTPEVTVARNVSLALDARAGKPVTVDLDNSTVGLRVRRLAVAQTIAGVPQEGEITATDPKTLLYAVPTEKVTSRSYSLVMREFRSDARTAYNLTLLHEGGIPKDPSYRVRTRDLAEVRTRIHGDNRSVSGSLSRMSELDESGLGSGWFHDVAIPGTTTEYFSAGPRMTWSGYLQSDAGDETGPVTRYAPGRRTVETWNAPAFSPIVASTRCGDAIHAELHPFSASAPGHTGSATAGPWTGRVTLLRDDLEVSSSDTPSSAELGGLLSGPARYTMRLEGRRDKAVTATRVRAEWTFVSSRPTEQECVKEVAPLFATRLDGDFGTDDLLPRDHPSVLRMTVEGTNAADVRASTIEASFDEGTTWRRLTSMPVGGGRFVAVLPPPGTGGDFVALRTTTHDSAGNTMTQIIERAYALSPRPGGRSGF